MHEGFNDAQKEDIRNIGFGCFLHNEVSKIHEKFAVGLLDRFDPYTNHLCLPKKKDIYIIAMDMHLTFALLIGGNNVVEVRSECNEDDFELVLCDLRTYWNL